MTKKTALLRMTNQKIVEKLSALKKRNKALSALVATSTDNYRRLIGRCSSRDEVERLVRHVCVETTPKHELIRYRRFTSALLRALAATEPQDAGDTSAAPPARRIHRRRVWRRRARPAAIADEEADATRADSSADGSEDNDGDGTTQQRAPGDWFSSWFD